MLMRIFMAEMCAGILVAVTDLNQFSARINFGRGCRGRNVCPEWEGREFITREGEIVLRDEKEIVCVLCQVADENNPSAG